MIDQKPIQPSYLELIPLKNFAKKEQEAQRQQFKDSQKQDTNDNKQMGIGSINWSKMLNKELEEEFKKKDEVLDELRARKVIELKQNKKLAEKNKLNELNEKGNQHVSALSKEEVEKIAEDEFNHLYSGNVQKINHYMKAVKENKLGPVELQLLKKLVDMNSMWDYDSQFIKKNIYNLFFDWKTEGQKKEELHDENKDDAASHNDEQQHNAEQDSAQRKMLA